MAFTESDWSAYCPITISSAQVAATMPDGGESGFPAVLVIDQANSVNYEGGAANIFTTVVDYTKDIAITLNDGATQVKHDVVEYVATAGSRLLVCHVLIPSLAGASDTVLRLYYRDDGAADQQQTVYLAADNWIGYWPLQEDVAGTGTADFYKDLTDNSNDGDDEVSATNQDGKVGAGQDFDGSDWIRINPAAVPTDYITVMSWVRTSATAIGQIITHDVYSTDTRIWQFRLTAAGKVNLIVFKTNADLDEAISGASVNDGAWQHVVGTWDGANILTYVAGANDGSKAYGGTLNSGAPSQTQIGVLWKGDGLNNYFDGNLDEVSLSQVARSADWITTTYNCQNDNAAFWTVGSEVAVGVSVLIPILMAADVRQAI